MIRIVTNGSRWNDAGPEPLERLLELLAREPLDPAFLFLAEEDGEEPHTAYEGLARVGVRNPEYDRSGGADVPEFIDGDPIYPESPDALRFFGNFVNVSHVFCIDTDEAETIERLRAAITSNVASEAFQSATRARARHALQPGGAK